MNRRQFIQTSVALGSLPLLAAPEQRRHPALTLGFSLYGMKTLKTEEALKHLSKIGYDSVELCMNSGKQEEDAARSTWQLKSQANIADDQY